MGCDNASFRPQRAERTTGLERPSQAVPEANGGARLKGRRGNGPPDAPSSEEHPSDPDPSLYAKLDELHAAVQAADSRRRRSRTSGQEASPPDDRAAYDVLAALGPVWIEWLIEAARNGDPAARAHFLNLGFHHLDQETDAKGRN